MSKILFLGAGGFGHINPMLPIARELQARGHDLRFVATGEFADIAARSGLAFSAYPESLTSKGLSAILQTGNVWAAWTALMRNAELLTPFTIDLLRRERPDVVVFDTLAIWGRTATRRLGVPSVATVPYFIVPLSNMAASGAQARQSLSQLWPALPGLLGSGFRLAGRYGPWNYPGPAPVYPMLGHSNISFTIPELQPPSPHIDADFHFVGPSIDAATRTETFEWDQIDPNKPLIYVSLGTVHTADMRFYGTLIEALAPLSAQIVMSVGRGTDIAALGDLPPHFIVRDAVPQLEILGRASAFITHAGMNSLHESLWFGVPMLAIPQQVEQLANARIAADRGAARVRDGALTGQPITADQIRADMQAILDDASYRASAGELGAKMRAMGGYKAAADAIEAAPSRHAHLTPQDTILPRLRYYKRS